MQLDKVVAYHKALADPTRIRMLILLAVGELNGQELAEKLAVTPATITHHAAKLREASLINERRERNSIFFKLNRHFIQDGANAAIELIDRAAKGGMNDMDANNERMRESVLRNFLTADGRLKSIPAQYKKKLIVLEHLASKLEKGRKYSEKEINEFIKPYHDDYATIRRELIMHQFMYREHEVYELNPQALWTNWEALG